MTKRKQHELRKMSGWEHFGYWSTALISSFGIFGVLVMCWFDSLIPGWLVFAAPVGYFLFNVVAYLSYPYSNKQD